MNTPELAPWLQRFFAEYLLTQRNVSRATIAAYRDAFRLLFSYLRKPGRRGRLTLPLDLLTTDTVLRFLDHLERQRGNTIRTRNARLAAIRSFVHYLSDWLGPELPVGVAQILAIPFKRHVQEMSGFLSRQEVEAILEVVPDTWTGRRDHLLVLLLYNTGARISEVLALRAMNLSADGKQIEYPRQGTQAAAPPIVASDSTAIASVDQGESVGPGSAALAEPFRTTADSGGCCLPTPAIGAARLGQVAGTPAAPHLTPYLPSFDGHGFAGSRCGDRSHRPLPRP